MTSSKIRLKKSVVIFLTDSGTQIKERGCPLPCKLQLKKEVEFEERYPRGILNTLLIQTNY